MVRAAISFRRTNLEFATSEAVRNEVVDSSAQKQLDHWPDTHMSAKHTTKYRANFHLMSWTTPLLATAWGLPFSLGSPCLIWTSHTLCAAESPRCQTNG